MIVKPTTIDASAKPAVSANRRKVNRAASVAYFNAITFAVFTFISLSLLPMSPTIAGVLITGVLGLVTYLELKGRKLLLQLDPRGARMLGWNQLLLLGALLIYCTWSIVWGFLYPSPMAEIYAEVVEKYPFMFAHLTELERRDMQDIFAELADIWPAVVASIYGAVIIASVFYQGGNAWYNFSRQRYVRACREEEAAAEAESGETT